MKVMTWYTRNISKVEMTTWNQVSNEPTPVTATRTTPPKHLIAKAKKSVRTSVAAHTQQFEVISA